MYLPPLFREDRIDVQHQLIRTHPLGLLITAGPAGLLANPIPFVIVSNAAAPNAGMPNAGLPNAGLPNAGLPNAGLPDARAPEAGERGTLQCHLSRANTQWRELMAVDECLVVFQGPQDYVTPSWYQTKRETGKVVPTWNYVTVHAWGKPRVIEDAAWIRRQIEALTRSREDSRPQPWHVDDAPEDYVSALIKGIIGVEIPIARIEGKWKLSQNRTEADRLGVIAGFLEQAASSTSASASANVMADLVAERNSEPPTS